jgi:predicted O-methyltransferase YrrM
MSTATLAIRGCGGFLVTSSNLQCSPKFDPKLDQLLSEMERFGTENDQRESDRKRKMLNLEPETASLLHILVRAAHRQSILEIGTSNGYSTIWLAHAVRFRNEGSLVSIERNPAKLEMARQNLSRAGLLDSVTLLEGEASDTVQMLEGYFDCVFFDADRISARKQLEILMPKLQPDVLLLADNVISHPQEIADYLKAVSGLPGFSSVTVPIGKGLHVAYRQSM